MISRKCLYQVIYIVSFIWSVLCSTVHSIIPFRSAQSHHVLAMSLPNIETALLYLQNTYMIELYYVQSLHSIKTSGCISPIPNP